MFFRNQAVQLLIDPANGKITDANHAAAQFYGYDRDDLRQMTVLELSLEPKRAATYLAEVASGRQGAILTQHQLASGAVRDVELQSSTVSRAGRTQLYAIVHDVTERLQRERELETVAHFAAALRTAPTRAAMLPVILEQVQALVGADGAALVLRDSLSGDLVVALAQGWPEPSGTHLADASGLASQVVANGQPEWRVAPAGTQAAAPLSAQGHPLGAVCVSLEAAPTPLQLRLLSAIADMTANALQRATLHEQTEQRLQRLAALHAIDLAITSSFDLRVTLGILLDHLMDQLEVGGAGILLLNAATQTLEYAAVRGLNSALMHQLPLRLGDSLASRVAATGQPVKLADLTDQGVSGSRPYHIGNDKFTSYHGLASVGQGPGAGCAGNLSARAAAGRRGFAGVHRLAGDPGRHRHRQRNHV
jgi:PAS domain S-box-containing protein